jgi:hypothetical protein
MSKTVEIPREDIRTYAKGALAIRGEFPSLFMGLNVAQYRAMEDMYRPTDTGGLPDLNSVEFANGVGKTHLMCLDKVGWTMGPDYLYAEKFPDCAIQFYRSLAKKRDSGKLSLRLVCTADDMKAGGSVYEILKLVFPWAKMTKQDNNGVYRQIDIPHPTIPLITNHIAIKTFDQPEDKHSGSTCDRIWGNENIPENIWGETSARTRGGGNIVQFATILDYSSHLDELEDATKFIMRRSHGHIFENCIGEELTDEMAGEVFEEIGIMLEKNKNGKGYITGGVLHRAKLESMIDGWARSCPHQLQARKTGKPISSGGKIHPGYSETVHMKKGGYFREIPKGYPVVQIVDPHPARPDASIWAVIKPSGRPHILKEWPFVDGFGPYESIKDKRFTVSQKCEIWKNLESEWGFDGHICARVGDPNRFKEPNPDTDDDLSSLYLEHGFDFDLTVNDGFEYGVEKVNEALSYDQILYRMHPEDLSTQPILTISEDCFNVNRALKNFSRKKPRDRTAPISEMIDKKFECFAACVRYLMVWLSDNTFDKLKANLDGSGETDMDRIQAGRIPRRYRKQSAPIDLHGRQLLETIRGH